MLNIYQISSRVLASRPRELIHAEVLKLYPDAQLPRFIVEHHDSHRLVLRVGDQRAELAPGGRVDIPGGTLVYERLSTWMGYRVSFDPTLPWLLAASLLAALSLAWHYTQRFVAESPPTPVRQVVPGGRPEMDHA